MGVDVPDLDDRTYEELLADARKRVPVHAPEWTDHNAHDPGITILELLAWLAETHTYQLDRIDDAHRRKYLGLVGVEPRSPRPASVPLALSVPRPGGDGKEVEDDGEAAPGDGGEAAPGDDGEAARSDGGEAARSGGLTGTDGPAPADLAGPADLPGLDGERIEAGTEVVAETPAGRRERFRTDEAVALSAARVAAVVAEHGGDRVEHTTANDSEGMHFPVFGPDPAAGDAAYLGFDANPFAHPELALWLDYHDADLPDPATHGGEAVDFEPSLRVVWEHCTRPGDWFADDAWEEVPVERDETRSLYRGGRVTLSRPDGWRDAVARVAGHDERLYWLRCRLAAVEPEPVPAGPCEPPESPGQPEPRYEVPPRLDRVAVDVIEATHREPLSDGELERPDGGASTTDDPGQTFDLGRAPVLSASVRVGGEAWTQVEDFAASGPDDRHYVLDRAAGTVTFGDGRRGTIPAPRETVSAEFVAGGGPDGTVPDDAEWAVPTPGLRRLGVRAVEPPSGGTAAESVDAALARARAQRRVPHRAVSAEDFAALATSTPGLRFGRAALAAAPGDGEAGRVVVVPYSPPGRQPIPSAGFLAAVEGHLCRHALLTERVEAVGPTFVDLAVTVEIEPGAGADPTAAVRDTRERVRGFLEPLSGFEGEGWPFGRPVYRSELYEQVETLDRVADAVDVGVRTRGDVRMDDREDTLPNLAALTVDVRDEREHCGRDRR